MVAVRYSRCPMKFLIWILITLLNTLVTSVAASLGDALTNVTFTPPYLDQLKERTNRTVWIHISVQRQFLDGKYAFETPGNITTYSDKMRRFASLAPPPPPKSIAVNFKVGDLSVARVVDPPVTANYRRVESFDRALKANGSNSNIDGGDDDDDDHWHVNVSFTVQGLFLGKTKVGIKVHSLTDEEAEKVKHGSMSMEDYERTEDKVVEYTYEVLVVRHDKKLAHIFVGTLMILLIMANVLMGAQLNLNVIFEVIKKPFAPAIGFMCQFLVMPLISFSLAHIFFVPVGLYNLGLGLFTTGCCPGGGASNAYTVLLDGNVDLSITMTFLSTLLSLATMPLWMFAMGRQFLVDHPGKKISIPYSNIAYSLLTLILPLCAGIMLRRFWPRCVDYAKKILRPFLGLIIVFICTFGVYANLYMFRLMTWRVLVGGLGLPWLGFAFGLGIALLARQPKPNVVAISIETGIQNTGIAIMLLQLSFTQPDADLAAVLPVVVAMFTPAPMIVALVFHYAAKWRDEKKKKAEKASGLTGNGTYQNKATEDSAAALVIVSSEDELGPDTKSPQAPAINSELASATGGQGMGHNEQEKMLLASA